MAFQKFSVSRVVLTPLVCACVMFHLTQATCPQNASPVLDDKVIGSDVVVQGRVRGQLRVNVWDRSYTAMVDVQCVFKGGPVPALINVTDAGKEEGKCVQTELLVGSTYLIYLRQAAGGSYTPVFTQDPADRKYLDELQYVCGLQVQLPTGVDSSEASVSCPPDSFLKDYELDCPETSPNSSAPSSTAETLTALWIMSCLLSAAFPFFSIL